MEYTNQSLTGLEIAVIGMAGRFPGARDLPRFWRNLRDGVESIQVYDEATLLAAGVRAETLADPTYVKAGADLDDAECFDAELFGYSPREAEIIDPQHRVFLEGCWAALEDAAYDPEQTRGAIGVFGSATLNNYMLAIYQSWMARGAARDLQPQLGNDKDYLASRVAYKLGLSGPSISVQSACSSSLVAVHLACQALLAGDCRLALAGGVSVQVPRRAGYFHQPGGIFSPDGKCRAFDADGAGTVFGSGMGVVVLARLEDALESRDRILAVIKGSAINNDGSDKVGFTAPGVDGQTQVIRAAQRLAEVTPDTVGYIEAHGTGTPLGDPIEVEALTQAFRKGTARRGFCGLGSVKTNVGHLGNAAGIAGLIKTILALEHGEIPPSLHFERPNPHIDFAASPFVMVDRLRPWPRQNGPRRAGVSSFGVGGTNAHVILEEAPHRPLGDSARPSQLLVISAHCETALDRLTEELAAALETAPEDQLALADAAFSLAVGRRRLRYRRFLTVDDRDRAVGRLSGEGSRPLPRRLEERRQRGVVFLLPGQGTQRVGSGAELYRLEPTFRATLDRCLEILRPLLDQDLAPLLLGDGGDRASLAAQLAETRYTQPAVFAIEVATAALLADWGVEPEALLGHSLGEITAAHLAGVFSLEDALRLVAERGRLIQSLPTGAMLSVDLGEQLLLSRLGDDLALAAVNAPHMSAVSGEAAAVDRFARKLTSEGIEHRWLRTSHAFHSPAMDPILESYGQLVDSLDLRPPRCRMLSNVTGTWLSDAQATDSGYWVDHLRRTVRFGDALETLLEDPSRVFLEVGPGRALASLARRRRASDGSAPAVVTTLGQPRSESAEAVEEGEQRRLLDAVGELWSHGVTIDWPGFYRHQKRWRVGLPTYPFEPQRFWIAASTDGAALAAGAAPEQLPQDRWYHVPCWKPTGPPESARAAIGPLLIVGDAGGVGSALQAAARRGGEKAVLVRPLEAAPRGDEARGQAEDEAFRTVRVDREEDWSRLLADLTAEGMAPRTLIHLGHLGRATNPDTLGDPTAGHDPGFFSLLAFARAAATLPGQPIEGLMVVTDGAQSVTPRETTDPGKALLLGFPLVLPRELEGLRAASVDFELGAVGPKTADDLAEVLWAEVGALPEEVALFAWRSGRRFRRDLETVSLPAPEGTEPLRERGVYLITGGLGGLGLAVARHLAMAARARLVLLSRSGLPTDADRDSWIQQHGWADATWRRIAAVRELETLGSEVLPLAVDVTDETALRAAIEEAEARFGHLDGVFHAAGVPGGGLAALKDPADAARVLAPKVRGTWALARALGDRRLDFFVLFSSTVALTGGLGQVDYAAGNAYLDGFAHHHDLARGGRTVAIDWPGWSDTGMAAVAVADVLEHPLLDRRLVLPGGVAYLGRLSSERHWVLAEHRSGGTPILPGTTYLELVRAAFADAFGDGPMELSQVVFQAPLWVPEGSERELRVLLVDGEPHRFAIESLGPLGPEVHAVGLVRRVPEETAVEAVPAAAAPSTPARALVLEELVERVASGGTVTWGARWHCRGTLQLFDDAGHASVELPAEHVDEVVRWGLHPALLDVATSCGLALAGEGDYLPFTYASVRVHGPLPSRLQVWTQRRRQDAEGLTLDVRIADPAGDDRVVIRGYTLRRMVTAPAPGSGRASGRSTLPAEFRNLVEHLEEALRDADRRQLTTSEGLECLRRILAHPPAPQVAVSKVPVAALLEVGEPRSTAGPAPAAETGGSRYSRPELGVPYEAPRNPLEEACAEVWRDVLALDRVGIHDNFFELGGHSLMGIQLAARLSEILEMEVTVATLFEHPTLAELVDALSARLVEGMEGAELDAALKELEDLSEDEVAALLAADGEERS